MTPWAWVGIGMGVFALVAWGRRPGASRGAVAPTAGIARVAEGIAVAEGYPVPGSIAQRQHNPGNLKLPADGGRISTFATAADGWAALYRQLDLVRLGRSAYYSVQTTIEQMGRVWTATVSEQGAWSRTVAAYVGVPVTTPLGAVLG